MIFQKKQNPILINIKKIWDKSKSNIMPSLIYFKGFWLCALKEINENKENIRIISSSDKINWTSIARISDSQINFSNPLLSITPSGGVIILLQGIESNQTYIAFSDDGSKWSSLKPILEPHNYLKELIWHRGKAYGLVFREQDYENNLQSKQIDLVSSLDGTKYSTISSFTIPGDPTDGCLVFSRERLITLITRNAQKDNLTWAGISKLPYSEWNWDHTQYHLEEPYLLMGPKEQIWAGGCISSPTPYGNIGKMILMRFKTDSLLQPMFTLPSGGKTVSPSLIYQANQLTICYSSSHETKNAIYLANVKIEP